MLFLFGTAQHDHAGHDHAGHDHGHGGSTKSASKTYLSKHMTTKKFEYVIHYKPFKANESVEFKIFISEFKTNKPVDNAQLKIEFHGLGDKTYDYKMVSSGIYIFNAEFPDDSEYELAITMRQPEQEHTHLPGISASENLAEDEEESEASLFNWLTYLLLGLGFSLGVVLTILLRKKAKK